MCELMGMCFARPVSADFSIRAFAGRGEANADGWGLAWYPDQSVAVIKEPVRWQASQYFEFLPGYRGLQASIYIAHVRLKTAGDRPTHADTHPFVRELGGRHYCFAHNGTLTGKFADLPLVRFHPVGKTDSEHVFCHLLDLVAGWQVSLASPQSWPRLHSTLTELNALGKLNCLLADGQRLFCYHDINGWKGLVFRTVSIWENTSPHFEDETLKVAISSEPANVGVVVATAPLSLTGWQPIKRGELLVLEEGVVRHSSH